MSYMILNNHRALISIPHLMDRFKFWRDPSRDRYGIVGSWALGRRVTVDGWNAAPVDR